MPEEVSELQKEWRAIVIAELSGLKLSVENLRKEVGDVKTSVAQAAEVQALRMEVDKLKEFKAKIIGITIALNAIGAAVAWFISTIVARGGH